MVSAVRHREGPIDSACHSSRAVGSHKLQRIILCQLYKDVIPSGRLKVVDYTAGISTSAIIERVIARNRAC
jgi:hypothetical protein